MSVADEKVIHPFRTIEARAAKAMADYKVGVADELAGKSRAIHAVIEYGRALAEGKRKGKELRNNTAFGTWVHDNKLDVGKPWDDFRERSSAMKIATLIGSVPISSFDACPNTTPTIIMKWYRKVLSPPAPKKRKPQKTKATPQTDAAYNAIVAWIRDGKELPPKKEFAKLIGISHMAVEKAHDRLHQEKAKGIAAKLSEDEALAKAEETFSDKSKLTVADAIRVYKARLDKNFEQLVGDEVRKRIAAANDAVRERLKKADAAILQFERERGLRGVFSIAEFNLLLKCFDSSTISFRLKEPDPDFVKRIEAAMILIRDNKGRLVNPEKK